MRICSAGAENGASSCSTQQQATQRVAAVQELDHRRPILAPQQTRRQGDATDLPRKTLDEIKGFHVNIEPLKLGQKADTSHDGQIGADVKTIAWIVKRKKWATQYKQKNHQYNTYAPW